MEKKKRKHRKKKSRFGKVWLGRPLFAKQHTQGYAVGHYSERLTREIGNVI